MVIVDHDCVSVFVHILVLVFLLHYLYDYFQVCG